MTKPTEVKLTLGERVDALEKSIPAVEERLFNAFDNTLSQHRMTAQNLVETIQAMILLGGEGFGQKVEAAVLAARLKREKDSFEKEKGVFESLIKAGVYRAGEIVDSKSVVLLKFTDADGTPRGVGGRLVSCDQLNADDVAVILGQKVGFKKDDSGGVVEIEAVYASNPDYKPAEVEAK